MPWSTPTLKTVRSLVRDAIRGNLPGADASVPNSVLRVVSDAMGALCHMTLQYVDWLALQLIPDTAETVWLDRHGDIWLTNADGTTGRKLATLAEGTATFIASIGGAIIPTGTRLTVSTFGYETTATITCSADSVPTPGPIRALDPGALGNQEPGTALSLVDSVPNVTGEVTTVTLDGGTDQETDDDLRFRVLQRIRQPPQGGAAHDYVRWTLAVPGVTRAWCKPLEMGIGTVTIRFMCDDLRADREGFPTSDDIRRVETYVDTVRPVAVKDFFVVAPIRYPIDIHITNLVPDDAETHAGIRDSLKAMLDENAEPGQTIYAAWKSAAVLAAPRVESFDMVNCATDDVMPSPGHLAVLGDIVYGH